MDELYRSEQLVELKKQEIQREVEQARLVKEARLSHPSWTTRVSNALHNLLKARQKRVQDRQSIEPQAYQSIDHKAAP